MGRGEDYVYLARCLVLLLCCQSEFSQATGTGFDNPWGWAGVQGSVEAGVVRCSSLAPSPSSQHRSAPCRYTPRWQSSRCLHKHAHARAPTPPDPPPPPTHAPAHTPHQPPSPTPRPQRPMANLIRAALTTGWWALMMTGFSSQMDGTLKTWYNNVLKVRWGARLKRGRWG